MKTQWLRLLIRKHGDLGVAMVGVILLLRAAWQRRWLVAAVAVCAAALLRMSHTAQRPLPASALAASYTITDLGALPGTEYSIPTAIDTNGRVVGICVGRNALRGFVWQSGRIEPLSTLGGQLCIAEGVNNSGDIVGYSETARHALRAVRWRGGRIEDLGTLGGEHSYAVATNQKGQIAGGSQTRDEQYSAFLLDGGKMEDLGRLPGDEAASATAISERGEIVGVSGYG